MEVWKNISGEEIEETPKKELVWSKRGGGII